jgi:hypothetical protein
MSDVTLPPVSLGGALITLVEAHPGHAEAYNRWYERDHFYSGVLTGPGVLAGGRFVAPPALKAMRQGPDSAFLTSGTFLAVYFLQTGEQDSFGAWVAARVRALAAHPDRMFPHRDHLLGGLFDHAFTIAPGSDLPDFMALDRRFAGLGFLLLEPGDSVSTPAIEACVRQALGATDAGAPAPLAIAFRTATTSALPTGGAPRDQIVILDFVDAPPSTALNARMTQIADNFVRSGLGRAVVSAPFRPTVPGSKAPDGVD